MESVAQFDQTYAAEQIRRSRHPIRRRIKKFYLDTVLENVVGPTIDFGCGAGQLLERLPTGSLGVEINPHLITHLRSRGLNVQCYNALKDHFKFNGFEQDRFQTLVLSHVLEHFEDAHGVLAAIMESCKRIGIKRIIIVVPGKRGYSSDKTHRTFINKSWIQANIDPAAGFRLTRAKYFPVDNQSIELWFTFHELQIIFDFVDN